MKKLTGLLSLILMLTILLAGCSPREIAAPPREPLNPVKEGPDLNVAFIKGDINEELRAAQEQYAASGQIYYEVIRDKETLAQKVAAYGLSDEDGAALDYAASFFDDYSIIAIFPGEGSGSIRYYLNDLSQQMGSPPYWLVEIEKRQPQQVTDDLVNRGLMLEIKNSLLAEAELFKVYVITKLEDFDREILTETDLQLGRLRVRMGIEEVKEAMIVPPVEEITEHDGYVKRLVYKEVVVEIMDGEASYISVTEPIYATPRGLKVGDTLERLHELYGEPGYIHEGVYSYAMFGEYFLFHAEVRDGIIVRLQVNLAC